MLVVGYTGEGVSSTINLIAGCPVSSPSPDAQRRTRRVKSYPVDVYHRNIDGIIDNSTRHPISLYEIPGFEGDRRDTHLIEYIRCLHTSVGIDLVLFCIRQPRRMLPVTCGKLRETLRDVRFAAVVTGLEREDDMRSWWTRPSRDLLDFKSPDGAYLELSDTESSNSARLGSPTSNGTALENGLGLSFVDHACVTTLSVAQVDMLSHLRYRREDSERQLGVLISKHCVENEKTPGTGALGRCISALNIRFLALKLRL